MADKQAEQIVKRRQWQINNLSNIGIRAGHTVMIRARSAGIKAIKGSRDPVAAITKVVADLAPLLVADMTAAHLQSRDFTIKLATKHAKDRLSLATASKYNQAIDFLQRRMELTDRQIVALSTSYGNEAVRITREASAMIEERVAHAVTAAAQRGEHVKGGVTAIRQAFDSLGITPETHPRLTKTYLMETLFRTSTQMAYNAGQWATNQEAVIDDILWGYEYSTVGDARVRPSHEALDGIRLKKDNPRWDEITPPNGFNCILPNNKINADVLWASKALYSGPAFEIQTKQGNRFTVTANHPIATRRGWIRAAELNEGDQLITDSGKIKLDHSASPPDVAARTISNNQRPIVIEDIYNLLLRNGNTTIQISPLDFHSDAKLCNNKIDIVTVDRKLMLNIEACFSQSASNNPLSFTDHSLIGVDGLRSLDLLGMRTGATANSTPSSAALSDNSSTDLLDFSPFDSLCFGSSASLDTRITQESHKCAAAYIQFLGDLITAYAGLVAFDPIVSIRNFDFSGHVYDLQTTNGIIVTEGVVLSNCRCSLIEIFDEGTEKPPPAEAVVDGMTVRPGADEGFQFNPGKVFAVAL